MYVSTILVIKDEYILFKVRPVSTRKLSATNSIKEFSIERTNVNIRYVITSGKQLR